MPDKVCGWVYYWVNGGRTEIACAALFAAASPTTQPPSLARR